MCIIAIAYGVDPRYPLVVAANRDEYYNRPTASSNVWTNGVLAGRDLQAGGTWMGMHIVNGRFAAVTNVRECNNGTHDETSPRLSRGSLVSNYLDASEITASEYINNLQHNLYNGFNLIVGDSSGLYYTCNRHNANGETVKLSPGHIYVVCNHTLDHPWLKVVRLRQALAEMLPIRPIDHARFIESVFGILQDDAPVKNEEDLPVYETGCSVSIERLLSSIFICADEHYGTRSSTVLTLSTDGSGYWEERSFGVYGTSLPDSTFRKSFSVQHGFGES